MANTSDTVGGWDLTLGNGASVTPSGLVMNGDYQYASFAPQTYGGAAMSFAFWANTDASNIGRWYRYFDFGSGGLPNNTIVFGATGIFVITNGVSVSPTETLPSYLALPTPIVADTWFNLVATVDVAGYTTLYMNGASAASGQMVPIPSVERTNNFFGKSAINTDYMTGTIADFNIVNSLLSATQVSNMAQGLNCIVPPVCAHHPAISHVRRLRADGD